MALIRICLLLLLAAGAGGAVAQDDSAAAIARGLGATLVLYSDDGREDFLGSGLVYGDDGVGLTNAHVVQAAASVVVAYRDGTRIRASVVARDKRRDIAVLRLTGPGPGLLPAPGGPPPIGTHVMALGAPLGAGFTATRGIVAADPRQVDAAVPLRLVQHDAAINPGSSGGPLIDMQGRLLGMNSQIANGSRLFVGISYAISGDDLARLVPRMLAGLLPPVPVLGVDLRPVNGDIAAGLGVKPTGLLVDHVQPGSAAARAGLRPGDILLAVGGRDLGQPGDLAFCLERASGPAWLTVWRAGQVRQVGVDLTADAEPASVTAAGHRGVAVGFRLDGAGRVSTIAADGLAARAGLMVDDRIVLANGRPVTRQDLMVADGLTPLVLLVERDDRSLHVILSRSSRRPAARPIGGNRLDLAVERF